MKFTCTVEIDLPKNKVTELFADENNLVHWQDNFESIDLISGNLNENGSQYRIKYNSRPPIELKETILEYNLPDSYIGKYEHKHMTNTMSNKFESINENKTRWTAVIDYSEIRGMAKIISWIFPSMFKKQTQKWLDQFKVFAENYKF